MVAEADYQPLFRFKAWHAIVTALLVVSAFVALIALNPPEPTKDMLADVDKSIVRKCHENQLYCTTSEPTGVYDHGKLEIRKFPDKQYHIRSIRLIAAKPEIHLPLLSQLPELELVMVPNVTKAQISSFKSLYPNLEFNQDWAGYRGPN